MTKRRIGAAAIVNIIPLVLFTVDGAPFAKALLLAPFYLHFIATFFLLFGLQPEPGWPVAMVFLLVWFVTLPVAYCYVVLGAVIWRWVRRRESN